MNAKQAEKLTGISRRNLRFYEDRGLIHPERNPQNDYRDYSEKNIENLKRIRVLRMLDASSGYSVHRSRADHRLCGISFLYQLKRTY